jgi:hypothetical protein
MQLDGLAIPIDLPLSSPTSYPAFAQEQMAIGSSVGHFGFIRRSPEKAAAIMERTFSSDQWARQIRIHSGGSQIASSILLTPEHCPSPRREMGAAGIAGPSS